MPIHVKKQYEMRVQVMNLDKTRNVMVGKQQRVCSKKENEGKKVEVVDGREQTGSNKAVKEKSEIILCIMPKMPKVTWTVGRVVGLFPRFVLLRSPLPIHRATLPKHQTHMLLQQQMRPHITLLHYNNSGVNFSCYLISSTPWAGERGRVV